MNLIEEREQLRATLALLALPGWSWRTDGYWQGHLLWAEYDRYDVEAGKIVPSQTEKEYLPPAPAPHQIVTAALRLIARTLERDTLALLTFAGQPIVGAYAAPSALSDEKGGGQNNG